MKIPKIFNGKINNRILDDNKSAEDKEKNSKKKNTLPFLHFDLEKNRKFPNISKKVKNASSLINSQTDNLLIRGFEGSEEDFHKYYHENRPKKFKRMASIKERRKNSLIKKDASNGIKLTITKEFNLSNNKTDKILEQIKQNKLSKSSSQYIKLKKGNNLLFYNLLSDNSERKTKQFNSSNSIQEKNKSNFTGTINMKNKLNERNSLKINTLYYYNKSLDNRNNRSQKLLNRSQSFKAFTNLTNILNETSNNVSEINNKIKKYMIEDKLTFQGFNSTKNKTISSHFFRNKIKEEERELKKIFDFSNSKSNKKGLKSIKNDIGLDTQNIWMKKSTANLILFGKIFLHLDDDIFYQEKKKILDDYPQLEKDADIDITEKFKKYDAKKLLRLQKLRFDKSNLKIKILNNMTDTIIKNLKKKLKNLKRDV